VRSLQKVKPCDQKVWVFHESGVEIEDSESCKNDRRKSLASITGIQAELNQIIILLDSNIRNSVCTTAKLPCRRVVEGSEE
jgi:hypothetical protein